MPLTLQCPNPACARTSIAPDAMAGRGVRCRICGQKFVAAANATLTANQQSAPSPDDATRTAEQPPAPSPLPPDAPATVGRFIVRQRLGAGAFGTVYRAYDPQLDREVAVKVPNPGVMKDAKRVERFLREAKAAARLRHPHIVPVFDAGRDGDTFYIASAFIDGKPLADAIGERGVAFREAARFVRELVEALAYAHTEGIVHRDVKPDNVLLDAAGHIHLMDFGLAARQDDENRLTNDGAVMGTPSYMAPEQAVGKSREAGPASDQYAAGVVLYELLTGKLPFEGTMAVVLHNVVNTLPEPPSKLRPGIPKDLETVCLKALAKRIEDRYTDCQALADDLCHWIDGEPIEARRESRAEQVVRWVRRHPSQAAFVATALLSIGLFSFALVVAGLWWKADRARSLAEAAQAEAIAQRDLVDEARAAAELAQSQAEKSRDDAERAKADALVQRDIAERAKSDAITQRTLAEKAKAEAERSRDELSREREKLLTIESGRIVQLAYENWHDGNVTSALAYLELSRPETRNWGWHRVKRLCQAKGLMLTGHTSRVIDLAFSQDGTLVATASADMVKVWDAQTGTVVRTFTGSGHDKRNLYTPGKIVGFCQGGSRLVIGNVDHTAKVWDVRTGDQILTLNLLQPNCADVFPGISPNGSLLATASAESRTSTPWKDIQAKIWNSENGKIAKTLTGLAIDGRTPAPIGFVRSLTFSPDGTQLVGSGQSDVVVWDTRSGEVRHVFRGGLERNVSVRYSPGGHRLVISGSENAKIWDTKTWAEILALNVKGGYVAGFSPDGTRLATQGTNGEQIVWDARSGAKLVTLVSKVKRMFWDSVTFSPDGTYLTDCGQGCYNNASIWDTRTGELVLELKGQGEATTVSISPDWQRFVTLRRDGTVSIWDWHSSN